MLGINNIYCGDALELLKEIKNESIDVIIVDPPYFLLNNEWDKKQWDNQEDYIESVSYTHLTLPTIYSV